MPTRRLAFHLRAAYDTAAEQSGLQVWPTADTVTWADWMERLVREQRVGAETPLRWLTSTTSRLLWDTIVRRDAEASSALLTSSGLAAVVQRSWQRLHDHRLSREELRTGAAPEHAVFERWSGHYESWLRDAGWIDVSIAAGAIARETLGSIRIGITGFDELTPQQRHFLDAARDAGAIVSMLAPPARASSSLVTAWPDRDSEFDAAARWVAERLDRSPGTSLAIVVEDLHDVGERVRRGLDRVLDPATALTGGPRPASGPYAIAQSRALSGRPMIASALDLLSLLADRSEEVRADELLRNPFLGGAVDEATARAALDARLRREPGRTLTLERLAGIAVAADVRSLSDVLRAVLDRQASWPSKGLPSSWATEFARSLSASGWPGAALDSVEHQTRERWLDLLATLGTCDVVAGRVSAREALRLLRMLADDAQFEPEQIAAPVLVTDARSCAGMQFDALWICGVDASRWPAPAQPDPFLPWHLQQRLRMRGTTAAGCAESAARTFARLQESALDVIASHAWAERDAELLPSPLLEGLDLLKGAPDWTAPAPTLAIHAMRPTLETLIDSSFPPLARGSDVRGGAALLEHEAACPFRAQARYRLRAEPLEQPAPGLDAATRGRLVHAVLENVWSELRTSAALQSSSVADIEALLDRAIDAARRSLRGPHDAVFDALLTLESRWLRARTAELLELDRRRGRFRVVDRESKHTLELEGLRLALKLDRVDELETGELVVIDYKTSRSAEPKAWAGERPELPQLPAYTIAIGAHRVAAVAFAALRAGDTRYAGLTRMETPWDGLLRPGSIPRRSRLAEFGDWESMISLWRRRIEALLREFREGDGTLAWNPRAACPRCHLSALCRIDEQDRTRDAEPEEAGADES